MVLGEININDIQDFTFKKDKEGKELDEAKLSKFIRSSEKNVLEKPNEPHKFTKEQEEILSDQFAKDYKNWKKDKKNKK